jgi:hypothetical protein
MTDVQRRTAIRGNTIRLTWTDGPTRGKTHEHVFHDDGTVEWRETASAPEAGPTGTQQTGAKERPEYAEMRVSDDIYVVSYLAASGYTLTVVLNFREHRMVGFASSSKEWHPLQGTFEVVS